MSEEKVNAQRRKRYHDDPGFRHKEMKRRRERYRDLEAERVRDATLEVGNMEKHGEYRQVVLPDGSIKDMLCFKNQELAEAMGYHFISMYRWQAAGKFPKPWVSVKGRKWKVFTENKARKILLVMGGHQKNSQYLKDSDSKTIGDLMAAVKTL